MAEQVGYAIGPMVHARDPRNARRFPEYLQTDAAQAIYARHGFVRASREELRLRAIPWFTGS